MLSLRKTQLFIACSLDGFIAGEKGEIDWLFTDQDYGYTPFMKGIDSCVMGRKTYELAASFLEWPYAGKKCFVLTRNKKIKKDVRAELYSNAKKLMEKLQKEKGKNIWLVGGGEIVKLFLDENWLDELIVFVHPLILGKGIPLFPRGMEKKKLKLLNTHAFETGLVRMHYAVEK